MLRIFHSDCLVNNANFGYPSLLNLLNARLFATKYQYSRLSSRQIVIVPNQSMIDWLKFHLTIQNGVLSGVEVISINAFFALIRTSYIEPIYDVFTKNYLFWHIFHILESNQSLFALVNHNIDIDHSDYIDSNDYHNNYDKLKTYKFATQLTNIFNEYLYHRNQMMVDWANQVIDYNMGDYNKGDDLYNYLCNLHNIQQSTSSNRVLRGNTENELDKHVWQKLIWQAVVYNLITMSSQNANSNGSYNEQNSQKTYKDYTVKNKNHININQNDISINKNHININQDNIIIAQIDLLLKFASVDKYANYKHKIIVKIHELIFGYQFINNQGLSITNLSTTNNINQNTTNQYKTQPINTNQSNLSNYTIYAFGFDTILAYDLDRLLQISKIINIDLFYYNPIGFYFDQSTLSSKYYEALNHNKYYDVIYLSWYQLIANTLNLFISRGLDFEYLHIDSNLSQNLSQIENRLASNDVVSNNLSSNKIIKNYNRQQLYSLSGKLDDQDQSSIKNRQILQQYLMDYLSKNEEQIISKDNKNSINEKIIEIETQKINTKQQQNTRQGSVINESGIQDTATVLNSTILDDIDDSITIYIANNKLEEIYQIVYGIIHHLNNNPSHSISDIIVLAPNISEYIVEINFVFDRLASTIPYAIFGHAEYTWHKDKMHKLDQSMAKINHIIYEIQQFFAIAKINNISFILQVLSLSCVIDYYGFTQEELSLIHTWLYQIDINIFNHNLFEQLLDSLSLGFCLNKLNKNNLNNLCDVSDANNLADLTNSINLNELSNFAICYDNLDSINDVLLLEKLIDLILAIKQLHQLTYDNSHKTNKITQWIKETKNTIFKYFPSLFNILSNNSIIQSCDSINAQIDFIVFTQTIVNALEDEKKKFYRYQYTGRLLFANIHDGYLLGYNTVYCIGLNNQTFPRMSYSHPLDLIHQEHQVHDRLIENEDKYRFLSMTLLASDKLAFSYLSISCSENPIKEIEANCELIAKVIDILAIHQRHPEIICYNMYNANQSIYNAINNFKSCINLPISSTSLHKECFSLYNFMTHIKVLMQLIYDNHQLNIQKNNHNQTHNSTQINRLINLVNSKVISDYVDDIEKTYSSQSIKYYCNQLLDRIYTKFTPPLIDIDRFTKFFANPSEKFCINQLNVDPRATHNKVFGKHQYNLADRGNIMQNRAILEYIYKSFIINFIYLNIENMLDKHLAMHELKAQCYREINLQFSSIYHICSLHGWIPKTLFGQNTITRLINLLINVIFTDQYIVGKIHNPIDYGKNCFMNIRFDNILLYKQPKIDSIQPNKSQFEDQSNPQQIYLVNEYIFTDFFDHQLICILVKHRILAAWLYMRLLELHSQSCNKLHDSVEACSQCYNQAHGINASCMFDTESSILQTKVVIFGKNYSHSDAFNCHSTVSIIENYNVVCITISDHLSQTSLDNFNFLKQIYTIGENYPIPFFIKSSLNDINLYTSIDEYFANSEFMDEINKSLVDDLQDVYIKFLYEKLIKNHFMLHDKHFMLCLVLYMQIYRNLLSGS